MDRTTLRQIIDDYLSGQHATLWGRAYDLSNPSSRQQAGDFLLEAMTDVSILAQQRRDPLNQGV